MLIKVSNTVHDSVSAFAIFTFINCKANIPNVIFFLLLKFCMKNKLLFLFIFCIFLLLLLSNHSDLFDGEMLQDNFKEKNKASENKALIEKISSNGNKEEPEVIETAQHEVPEYKNSEILLPQSSHPEYLLMFDEFSESIQGIDLTKMTKSECEFVLIEYVRITSLSQQYRTFGFHMTASDARDERLQYNAMATDELTSLAWNDVVEAMFTVGNRLIRSSKVDEVKEGKEWLFKAVVQGNVQALGSLKLFYKGISIDLLQQGFGKTLKDKDDMQLVYEALWLKRQDKKLPEEIVSNENIMRMVDELWEEIVKARESQGLPPLENYPLLELPLEMDWDNCKGIVV